MFCTLSLFYSQPNTFGSGAGYGAVGGSVTEDQPGGSFYGVTSNPNDFGSGGGNSSGNGIGGSGGGLLRLKLSGVLKLEGNSRLSFSLFLLFYSVKKKKKLFEFLLDKKEKNSIKAL